LPTCKIAIAETNVKTYHTAYPPNKLRRIEIVNNAVQSAGPTARARAAPVWAIPFTAPRERLLGGEAVMKVKMVAEPLVSGYYIK
jgi:hypothetical protein